MRRKNSFSFIVFSEADGTTHVRKDELLRTFDEERSAFPMDYENPRESFNGEVTGEILSREELKAALAAYEMFVGKVMFPENYAENLQRALEVSDQVKGHIVTVEPKG